uniref:Centriole, cilia and spindle associated protein n=2 Tax=Sus scrofa TaxID=9823 RepID=A0A4X1U825_PIG
MSPGSGVKSEYMKRYQEPRWDEYGPCYRALRHYRLGRRLLEQAHAPWLWDDWGPASDDSASSASSGAGAPLPQCTPASPPPPAEPAARDGLDQPAHAAREEQGAEAVGDTEDAEDAALPALSVKDIKEKPEPQIRTKETDRSPSRTEPRQPPSAFPARGGRRVVKSPQRSSSKIKENKHPFALYGWGEKQTDTGSQKTHNVCASAPVHEIHESALRAKSRRQVEKRRLVAQRQRAHSADVEKNRRVKPASSENPWMTEYMRCFSARA